MSAGVLYFPGQDQMGASLLSDQSLRGPSSGSVRGVVDTIVSRTLSGIEDTGPVFALQGLPTVLP